jgi:hypothetical protein
VALHRIHCKLSKESVRSLDLLIRRLRRPSKRPLAIILLAETQTELQEVLALACWLEDFRVILIVPDSTPETITSGHRLRPRYLTYADGDFSDVASVVEKLVHSNQKLGGAPIPGRTVTHA